jgi:2-haloacid dehalogenase
MGVVYGILWVSEANIFVEKKDFQILSIIFDFGGVLLDWNPRYLYRKLFQGNDEAMERFLTEVQFSEWNLQQDAGRPFTEAVDDLCAQFPGYCEMIRAYDTRWEESISGPIQPTVDILESLKQAGYPLVGLSNWSTEKFQLARHKYKFLDCFETILISGDVKLVKPDPRIFALLLDRIQRTAGECLLIDDTVVNITVARQLGFQTLHYKSPKGLQADLHQMGLI